jgi:hypothetical protein
VSSELDAGWVAFPWRSSVAHRVLRGQPGGRQGVAARRAGLKDVGADERGMQLGHRDAPRFVV